jgi:hypothetical protein
VAVAVILVNQVKVAVLEVVAAKAVVVQQLVRLHHQVKETLAVGVVLLMGMRLEVAVVAVLLKLVMILEVKMVKAVMEQ